MPLAVTQKLYHLDSDRLEFDATLRRSVIRADGRCEAILDRTCFYPGGGGQPADRGVLGGAQVLELREEDGEVVHVLDAAVAEGPVRGRVDAGHRRDFMAQHTGQHIFSQALVRAGKLDTVSVHLGEEESTIEVAASSVAEEVLRRAEAIANGVIRENRPVLLHEIDHADASRFPLRRTPPDEERLRIVEVKEFDWAACGGVHVRSTGAVVLVKAASLEKIRGRVRIHLRMGDRAFEDYGRKIDLVHGLTHVLTCGEEHVLERVRQLMAAQQDAARELRRLRVAQAGSDAREAVSRGRRLGEVVLVRAVFDEAGPEYLKAFCEQVVAAPGRIVLAADRTSQSFQWVAAHSLGAGVELPALVSPHFPLAAAKGGGRGERMQGVGDRVEGLEGFLDAVESGLERRVARREA